MKAKFDDSAGWKSEIVCRIPGIPSKRDEQAVPPKGLPRFSDVARDNQQAAEPRMEVCGRSFPYPKHVGAIIALRMAFCSYTAFVMLELVQRAASTSLVRKIAQGIARWLSLCVNLSINAL